MHIRKLLSIKKTGWKLYHKYHTSELRIKNKNAEKRCSEAIKNLFCILCNLGTSKDVGRRHGERRRSSRHRARSRSTSRHRSRPSTPVDRGDRRRCEHRQDREDHRNWRERRDRRDDRRHVRDRDRERRRHWHWKTDAFSYSVLSSVDRHCD